MSLILTKPWTRQPQFPVGPDKGTKFGSNCFVLWSAVTPTINSARSGAATTYVVGAPVVGVGPAGRSTADDSGAQNARTVIDGITRTTAPFSFTSLHVLRGFTGSNATTFFSLGTDTAGVSIGHDSSRQMYIAFGNARGALYVDTPGYITVNDTTTDWFAVAVSWNEPSSVRIVIRNLNTGEWKEATGSYGVGDWAAPGLDGTFTVGDRRGAGYQKYTHHVLHAASLGSSTSAELRALCANPWRIFAPLPRRIFVGATAGGATTYTKTATLDAAIQEAKTATATLDAAIRQTNTQTATLDGVIATRNTTTVTLDAAIRQAVTATVTLDAAIRATIDTSSTLDAVIQNAGVNTYTVTATIDAAIREAKSLTATLDAAIQIANTKTVTLDGVIVSVNTKTATLDATIQEAATLYALLDAYIFDAAAPVVVPDTRQTPAGKKTRNSRRRYIMPDNTIVMATPDEAEQLVKLFVKPKPVKKVSKQVVKELRKIDLVEFEPQSSDTVETEKIVVKARKAVWEPQADVYEKAMKLLVDRETKRRRHEEELILLAA